MCCAVNEDEGVLPFVGDEQLNVSPTVTVRSTNEYSVRDKTIPGDDNQIETMPESLAADLAGVEDLLKEKAVGSFRPSGEEGERGRPPMSRFRNR